MNAAKYYISLDVNKSLTSQHVITMKKGDSSCRIIASLTDGGYPYELTDDCYAVFRAKTPRGTNLYNSCSIEGNTIIYDVNNSTTASVGQVDCEITVYGSGSKQLTSPRFTVMVEDSLYSDSEVVGTHESSILATFLSDVLALNNYDIADLRLRVVSSLPASPVNGDHVVLLNTNTITTRDSGLKLYTSADMLHSAAEHYVNDSDSGNFQIVLKKNNKNVCTVDFLSYKNNGHNYSDFQISDNITSNGKPDRICRIRYVDGVFSSSYSNIIENSSSNNSINTALTSVPNEFRIPEFDDVYVPDSNNVTVPLFFTNAELYIYKNGWTRINTVDHIHTNKDVLDEIRDQTMTDIADNTAARHSHNNKATLDGFLCDALEAAAATPPGQSTVGLPYTGWDRLRWGDSEVRMAADGGVVRNVETVTHGGKSFLRLWLDYGEAQTIWQGMGTRPDYIDIPIDSATASTTTQGELTVNGTLLDLGVDSLASDSHTHANKSLLDGFGAAQLFTGVTIAQFQAKPICDTPAYAVNTNGYSGSLYAGAVVKLTQEQTAAVTIMGLTNTGNYQTPEYLLDFTTGATVPSLTLPASVEWVDELTVEANKHYQISILDNVALWCAVDVGAVNE